MFNMINKVTRTILIMSLAIGWGSAVHAAVVSASPEVETIQIKPQVQYQARGRRDPFVKPVAGQLHNVMQKVDIETLRLTGVIRNSRQVVALFAAQSGPKFGFLLKNGKLFRENHQTVSGISGKVVNPEKVILKQGGKQIVFKLRAN